MIKYDYPLEANQKYWIKAIKYECKECGNIFIHELPLDDDLVKLIEKDGIEIKWLPTFGIGGFLDLVQKIAPELSNEKFNGIGSIKLEIILESRLPNYTEKGSGGNGFIIGGSKHICPKCKSKELKELDEKIIENPKLDWVKISCELLK